jgi:D-alanyl-D-alanine carboxypeptidase
MPGYVQTTDNKIIAFSILINHCPVGQKEMRNIEDRIIETLAGMLIK